MLFTYLIALTLLSQKIGTITLHALNANCHHLEGGCEKVLDFLHSNTGWELTSPCKKKTSPHQRKTLWTTFFIIYRLKKSIIKMYPCNQLRSFKVSNTVVLQGPRYNNIVALHGDIFETLIFQTSCLRRLSQWNFMSSTNSIQFLLPPQFLSCLLFCLAAILFFSAQ
jgi:hypothetical protein